MMRLRALLGKELRQHGLLLGLLITILIPIELLALIGLAVAPQTLTVFEAQATFLRFFVPLFAMVLGNRLIVSEYQQRSQLFLEGLPLRRWEMVSVKWVLGLLVLGLLTMLAFGTTALAAAVKEPLTGRFIALMSIRSLAWVVAIWGFMFGMGFTGRFRLPIYLGLGLLLSAVSALSDFELDRFAVFAVVDQTFALERETLNGGAVAGALAWGLGWTALGFGLGLAAEGNLAEALARRMSAQEKSAVGALVIISIVIISSLEDKKEPAPFAFPDKTPITRSDTLPIEIAYGSDDHRQAAEQLTSALQDDLETLPERLGWKALPAVRITWSGALDGRTFETVPLKDGDGILVRAAFDAPDFDPIRFRAEVIRALLLARTHQRADFEPYAFFLDGYARHVAEAQEGPEAAHVSLLRALYITRETPVTPELARHWHQTREQLGPAMSEAVARSAIHALAAAGGAEAPDAVARTLFDGPSPDNARALFELHSDAPHQLIADKAGRDNFEAFTELWAQHLTSLRAQPWAAAAARIPQISASFEISEVEGEVRSIEGTLRASKPLDRDAAAALIHHPLTPFDEPLIEREMERVEIRWEAGASSAAPQLVGRYGPGERAFLALELWAAALDCKVRVAAERRVIR